jgi:hypothetical protein
MYFASCGFELCLNLEPYAWSYALTRALRCLQAALAGSVVVLNLREMAKTDAELELLQGLSLSEDDPAGLFSWDDIAVGRFHAAASVIPVLVVNPLFAITATPAGFKTALLQYLAAQAAPGAVVIAGGTLGITCLGADGFGRLTAKMDRFAVSAWVARVLAAEPLAQPLATLYTGAMGAAGKNGAVVPVLLGAGLFA